MGERRHLGLVQSFDEGKKARIDDPAGQVAIGLLDLAAAFEVTVGRSLDPICAGEQVVQKGVPHRRGEPLVTPVIELGQNQRRDDEVLVGAEDQIGAARVVGICCVKTGEQRAGVEDRSQSA